MSLPFGTHIHNRDPLDRMLAAVTLAEQMIFLSSDAAFDRDGLARLG